MRYRMNNFIFIASECSISNISIMKNALIINIVIMRHTFKCIS